MGRLTLVVLLALVLVPGAAAQTRVPGLPAPTGLRAFELRADKRIAHSCPRTPSFSWQPVAAKGGHHDFEPATSQTFAELTSRSQSARRRSGGRRWSS
jgi:hypothetical protein